MKKSPRLYSFIDDFATFRSEQPEQSSGLYFPLCNEEGMLSSITPNLHGDIKLDQHSFLNQPVSIEDLHLSRSSRNFWINDWSVTGQSAWQQALKPGEESVELEAGFLSQKIKRTNKKLGLQAEVLNFVPSKGGKVEVMMIEIKNISKKPIQIKATSAIPLFGRSADNLRDHRHVTSLLNRLQYANGTLTLTPTMSFNERGHLKNQTAYFVSGMSEGAGAPIGVFPTMEGFIGEGGSLDRPAAIFTEATPKKKIDPLDAGKEAIAALRFQPVRLAAGKSAVFILVLGIDPTGKESRKWIGNFDSKKKILAALEETHDHWQKEVSRLGFYTRDDTFNQWMKWVKVQPTLRKIFGNSFLPDFDYGRGGRGWRDLWQDCLALLLFNPKPVRDMILHNFGGVRMDGTNATIIGKNKEFIADRNNITRTWMDHGVWPYLTTELYLHQTGDWSLLFENAPYFEKNNHGGTLLEHILVQHLIQFFNVGEHNIIRLLDADWNDGLDMAHQRGESVAFTNMFASNLDSLADLLELVRIKRGLTAVEVSEELKVLLDQCSNTPIDYNSIEDKKNLLNAYLKSIAKGAHGGKASISSNLLISDLRAKAKWIKQHLNQQEWVSDGKFKWLNGYYDNDGQPVDGKDKGGAITMTLTGQVFPIMGRVVDEDGVRNISDAVEKHLYDSKLGGYRLNTDFGGDRLNLGRAFSFAYGEKENGAIFSHMVVMYANALYQRGFVKEGFKALSSLYRMAVNSERSRIFPGIPEYFNGEGRGRYHYLTGSASWYILTLLTQAFGLRGIEGDLLLAPKLMPEQFDAKGEARVSASFAGTEVTVVFRNPKKVAYETFKIESVADEKGRSISFSKPSEKEARISRETIEGKKNLTLVVSLS